MPHEVIIGERFDPADLLSRLGGDLRHLGLLAYTPRRLPATRIDRECASLGLSRVVG